MLNVGIVFQDASKGPWNTPHPRVPSFYQFPQVVSTPDAEINILRPTAKGCGPQRDCAEIVSPHTWPLESQRALQGLGVLRLSGLGQDETAQKSWAPLILAGALFGGAALIGILGNLYMEKGHRLRRRYA